MVIPGTGLSGGVPPALPRDGDGDGCSGTGRLRRLPELCVSGGEPGNDDGCAGGDMIPGRRRDGRFRRDLGLNSCRHPSISMSLASLTGCSERLLRRGS